jgi:hypothetical protein
MGWRVCLDGSSAFASWGELGNFVVIALTKQIQLFIETYVCLGLSV